MTIDKETFFDQKPFYMPFKTPTKDIQAPVEASSPTENYSNMKFLLVPFPGSGSADPFKSGS